MRWIRLFVAAGLALTLIALAGMLLNRTPGSVVEAQAVWPLKHKKLSDTPNDSTGADIEVIGLSNNKKVAVVVWMEGTSDYEIVGSIKMRWQFEGAAGTWRMSSSQTFPSPSGDQFPALALHQAVNGDLEAHIVWLRQISGATRVVYQKCTLTESSAVCADYASLSDVDSAAPAIALDAAGIPHVVWEHNGQIYYVNKFGGTWGTAWPMQTDYSNSSTPDYKAFGKSPAIAVDSSSVYVAWDRETTGSGEDPRGSGTAVWYGIWFARRSDLSAVQSGNTEGAKWQMDQVSQPSNPSIADELEDDLPSLGVGLNGVYLAWQRLVVKAPQIGSPYCREYQVAYRVFTGADVAQDWWPGSGTPFDYQYQSPFTATTFVPSDVADTAQDLYSGARPSIQVVSPGNATDQLHIAWQQSAYPSCSGGGGGGDFRAADVEASGEGDVSGFPLAVYHAYAAHAAGLGSVSAWVSQLITVQNTVAGFLASPDLAVIPNDKAGAPDYLSYPHVAMLDRFKTTYAYAWNVWYANDMPPSYFEADDPKVYLPIVLKNYY
ncbi:MAG: hypothetical protein JW934_24515 [Anaerolineae bacterium]|nr:hypothetical protein [Anaerolineae bacterium]